MAKTMNDRRFMRIAKALADPKRFSILARIAAHPEVACQQLLAKFKIRPATMSHHLKELAAADLVEMRREGKLAYLRLRPATLKDYQKELARRTVTPSRRRRKT